MSVHVLLDSTFFATSVPVADQQRVLLVPPGKGLNVGDTIFLRNEAGDLTWVSDVLAVGEMQGCEAWLGKDEPPAARHASQLFSKFIRARCPAGRPAWRPAG